MTSILTGIFASQISGHLYTLAGSYDALASVTVPSGGLASVTFAGIPTGYTHLQLRIMARLSTAASSDAFYMQINGDTGSNYTGHQIYSTGSGTPGSNAFGGNPSNSMNIGQVAAASATAGMFGVAIIDILDYASVYKNKTFRSLTGEDLNGSGDLDFRSGSWMNASTAISSINIYGTSNTFTTNSSFALYGVK